MSNEKLLEELKKELRELKDEVQRTRGFQPYPVYVPQPYYPYPYWGTIPYTPTWTVWGNQLSGNSATGATYTITTNASPTTATYYQLSNGASQA